MGAFDLLSDLDFEEFIADLFRAETGLSFRAGTRGRDAGVDVLAADRNRRRHEIQCKHYRDSTWANLRAAARADAKGLAKRKHTPTTYRFVTSRRLTHEQRSELAEILNPWCQSEDDIYGDGDLRALLRRHEAVERRHVKLWLSGAAQLRRLLMAGEYARTASLLGEIEAMSARYVQTAAFLDAQEILSRERVCVIAGPPGVGKTTLARLLLLQSVEVGFTPYEIVRGQLSNAWALLEDTSESSIFYFDDFLGETSLDATASTDRDLLKLISAVARSSHARLVMTTREYILAAARQLSEALDLESSPAHRFLLTMPRYSREERARIFYNHIWASPDVDQRARASLLDGRLYLRVIDHEHYSPRLIEWITGLTAARSLTDTDREHYGKFCLEVLDHPDELWRHAFESGLDDATRTLLLTLVSLPRDASTKVLESAFDSACQRRGISTRGRQFRKSLQILDDSFVTISQIDGETVITPVNPSVIDFVERYLADSPADAVELIEGATVFEQVGWLWGALSHDTDVPRSPLLRPLGAAFARTFNSRPVADAPQLGKTVAGPEHLERRIQALLARRRASAEVAASLDEHLPEAATMWLSAIEERDLGGMTVRTAEDLMNLGALDGELIASKLKPLILRQPSDSLRFELLGELHDAVPDEFSTEEWSAEQERFEDWVDGALAESWEYFDELSELENLNYVADRMDIQLDTTALDDAYAELETVIAEKEAQRYEDWEPDVDRGELRELRESGDSDAEIVAIFDRLASH